MNTMPQGTASRPATAVTGTDDSTDVSSCGYFRSTCRLCLGGRLEMFLDLGLQPHSDGFVPRERLTEPEMYFPLAAMFCADCGQVQINYVVKPEKLYGSDYLYDSTITATGRNHFLGMAKSIVEDYRIPAGALAVDIGSNVGLLLSGFREQGLHVQGVDPTPKMTKIAMENGIDTIVECFSVKAAEEILRTKGKAAVVTGTNVIAHIDDLDELMAGIDLLLEDNGIFVLEAPYLADLIEKLEYDTIYHQHLSYFAITPLQKFFGRFDMEIFDVLRTSIHGGSVRIFVGRKGTRERRLPVDGLVQSEADSGLLTVGRMRDFARRVTEQRSQLIRLLIDLRDQGYRVAGIGAPAKGSTLLNYCGINSSVLPYTTEKNKLKVGLYTPGTHIPILTDEDLLRDQPDYALILTWNFAQEIMANLREFKAQGGKFIIPIPTPTIV